MRSRQRRGELEPDNLSPNDGRRIHDTSVCEGQPLTQAIRPCIPPNLPQPPGNTRGVRLDPTVCALGIKAATTKQAIVALCELGDGANALALTRVLLENACLLEWLIRGEGRRRLESYVMFMSVQHERIAETIDRHRARFLAAGATGEIGSDPSHRAVWNYTFRDAKNRPTRSDPSDLGVWSDDSSGRARLGSRSLW